MHVEMRGAVSSEAELKIPQSTTSVLVGRVLSGRWTVERLIGSGGMSTVYEARHRNGKLVAVKVLHPHLAAHPRAKKRFLREGFLANQVGHPGAVSVLDDDVDEDGTVFLVMELLQGETLARRVERQGSLPTSDALRIMDEILAVLVAAHEKGIVHRDLKPSNIFLTEDGQVKVLDFGIARLHEETPRTADSFSTQLGGLLGTPGFMAPEQARGAWNEVDGRTDLWALGATMFIALTGRAVHRGTNPNELMIAAATQAAPPIRQYARLPTAVAEIIDRALQLDPNDRWPDASTLRQALTHAEQQARTTDGYHEAGAAADIKTLVGASLDRPWFLPRQVAPTAAIACAVAAVIAFEVKSLSRRSPPLMDSVVNVAAPAALTASAPALAAPAGVEVASKQREDTEPVIGPGGSAGEVTTAVRTLPMAGSESGKVASNDARRNATPRTAASLPSKAVAAAGSAHAVPAGSAAAMPPPPADGAGLLDRWQ